VASDHGRVVDAGGGQAREYPVEDGNAANVEQRLRKSIG
jgi:hypothetical protein